MRQKHICRQKNHEHKGTGLWRNRFTACAARRACSDPKKTQGKIEKPLQINDLQGFCVLAEWTGLEPATPGVTGRYSNQLNYHSW